MYYVDLNCDMGESYGAYRMGNDEAILPYITSANIACGYHAGDPATMRKTVQLALENDVKIGAHPGLPDLQGFGRRNMAITAEDAYDMVVYQVGALQGFVQAEGGVMQHVKPHGALYNMAAAKPELAKAIAEAVYRINPQLYLVGLAGSHLITEAEKAGLRTKSEVFADRTYQQDGTLTPRSQSDALITSDEQAVQQVIRMIKEGKVLTRQGVDFAIKADTVCIHGDGAHALSFAREIRETLEKTGVKVRAMSL
ncbi:MULTISPECIES: 5-oxoprolinase subunit PxpA [Brevibacillus]|uniref:5-oxoprolinase subunit PxpA n=1 Tax=Brevibacillus TaxID=55080 RepID=UPI00203B456D|nr:5-oxoprolinase subunit PxpA [Brevibacillus sp. AY1]MCM3081655.1 5-oxoprolinase subunit PxpA [Brevibacillus invocatus]MCM3431992.1 5-oxoprolinase subunit PxpA [Brevibacillus invocatus]MDH4619416.1 5-oxoprolinase subunit PxpA [Brevibacillus sp. AY1]